jgi:phosphatidylglycerol---prolipoprotein diacylglyceryl transferase
MWPAVIAARPAERRTVLELLYININIDPNIGTFGPFQITWHGVFTAVGIAVAVLLAAYYGKKHGILEDDVYNVALWSVPGGIVGARLLYVIEHFGVFRQDWGSIFSINEGGISIYGGVIGGIVVGFLYAWRAKLPKRRIADVAAVGLIAGQAVGRIGDFINGEHWAKATSLPWGFCYTNPNTLNGDPNTKTTALCGSLTHSPLNPPAVHPVAGLYEPLLLLAGFAVLVYLYNRLHTAGYIIWVYALIYAVIRFFLSYLRLNETMVFNDFMTMPQLIAVLSLPVILVGVLWTRREARRDPVAALAIPPPRPPSEPLAAPRTRNRPAAT